AVGTAARVERDLLAPDGREVAVEREQELLDVPALLVVLEADARAADLVVAEDVRVEEAEERVDRAVVQEAEAADLGALEAQVDRRHAGDVEITELADLLVEVPQVRDLHDLLLVLEAAMAVRAEVAERGLEAVAALAGEAELGALERARESVREAGGGGERLSGRLGRRERVVERANRVRRQRDLEREVGELLHVRRVDLTLATEQVGERHVEVVERGDLVERRGRSAGWVRAIAAPVHRPAALETAQG